MSLLSLHCRLPTHTAVCVRLLLLPAHTASSQPATACYSQQSALWHASGVGCHRCLADTPAPGMGQVCPLPAAICRGRLCITHRRTTALQLRLHTAMRLYVLQLLVFELMVWSRWAMGESGQLPWTSPLLQTLLYVLLGVFVPLGLGVTMEVSCSLTRVQGCGSALNLLGVLMPVGQGVPMDEGVAYPLKALPGKRHPGSQEWLADLAQLASQAPASQPPRPCVACPEATPHSCCSTSPSLACCTAPQPHHAGTPHRTCTHANRESVCVCLCVCVYQHSDYLQAQLRQTFLQLHDRSLDNLGPFWQGYLKCGDRLDRSGRVLMQRLKPVSGAGGCLVCMHVRLGTQVPGVCCSSSSLVDRHGACLSGTAVQCWSGTAHSCCSSSASEQIKQLSCAKQLHRRLKPGVRVLLQQLKPGGLA